VPAHVYDPEKVKAYLEKIEKHFKRSHDESWLIVSKTLYLLDWLIQANSDLNKLMEEFNKLTRLDSGRTVKVSWESTLPSIKCLGTSGIYFYERNYSDKTSRRVNVLRARSIERWFGRENSEKILNTKNQIMTLSQQRHIVRKSLLRFFWTFVLRKSNKVDPEILQAIKDSTESAKSYITSIAHKLTNVNEQLKQLVETVNHFKVHGKKRYKSGMLILRWEFSTRETHWTGPIGPNWFYVFATHNSRRLNRVRHLDKRTIRERCMWGLFSKLLDANRQLLRLKESRSAVITELKYLKSLLNQNTPISREVFVYER
jgi:hypothetical protein